MKREELKALGLEDDLVNQIMGLHGKTVNELNSKLTTAEQQATQYQEQLQANQTELDTLKESAKGNDDLTQQLADLQTKFDNSEQNSKQQLAEQQKDFAIKLALKEANALDENIVLGLLDRDTIKVAENGLQGFSEQLETLKTDKSFLFQQTEPAEPATPKIVTPGNPTGTKVTEQDKFAQALGIKTN